MLKYDNTVSSQVDGKPIYGAQVSVYMADTPSLATIFADEAGTTPLSQPILTDQLGYFAFYIGDGKYNIRVMTGAVEISRTNITMVDTLQLKQRALIVPVNEDGGTLPPADQRQGRLLGFDSGGNPTMAVPNEFAGPTGPADNTYSSYAALMASDKSRRTASLSGDTDVPPHPDARYYSDGVSAWSVQPATGVNFDGRNTDAKLRENVATTDARFAGGANPVGAADATAAFNAAKAASLAVSTPGQRFILNNLALDRDYQRWELGGSVWSKAAAAPVTTITGRGVKITGGDIDGGGGSTDNIVINGQEAEIRVMSNRATTGRAILAINASATVIFGGIHKTEDTSGNGYDIEFRNTGAGSLYNKQFGTASNQNTGGTLANGAGACHILGNQMGKFTAINGGGGFVVGNRIGGVLNVQSSSLNFSANNFAQDLVFGTDNQPNIGNIGLGPTNFGQTGKTIDIANNVRESQFFLDQFVHPTTTINIRSPQNAIYLREQAVSLGLGAASGSPTFGNGTVKTQCAYMGWQRKLVGGVTFGSTTNFGGGNAFYFVAPFKAKSTALGTAFATDAGTGFYTFICRMLEGSDQIFFFPTSSGSAVGNPASATSPFTWATDDSLVFEILFEQMAS